MGADEEPMKINGLMIDCARLLEPREYYHRLVDFMADWGMNTLLLHFSDDHGLALKLRGFGDLALPNAFTEADLARFLEFAHSRGVEVIPELETFGHTRYITEDPRYRHLFAGRWTRAVTFNAIDPLHEDTHALMRRLIRTVARLFPSRYIHLGCDEVDLAGYCRRHGQGQGEAIWADYVNRLMEIAREAGKVPMIWADHVGKSDIVARRLSKDAVLVEWRYSGSDKDDVVPRLKNAGFQEIIVAPSIACYRYRFLPPRQALENTNEMLAIGQRNGVMGLINTVWCPWRYLQETMYYGIAYSAVAVGEGKPPDTTRFNRLFARRVFDTRLTSPLSAFLAAWSELSLDHEIASRLVQSKPEFTGPQLRRLRALRRHAEDATSAARAYTPRLNEGVWRAMVLSARCVWVCATSVLLRRKAVVSAKEKREYNETLSTVRRQVDAEWDRTRHPDDPLKDAARFPNDKKEHSMLILRRLRFLR